MGHETVQHGVFSEGNEPRAAELLEPLHVSFSPTALIGSLSLAAAMVEIAKALSMYANFIIMDETDAALTKASPKSFT
jgi:ABC-type sugar transport system ATPase subunit